jgi:hypothetical protein
MGGDDEEEITEEMVEGIYVESQHKIETMPGYAEAFKRVQKCFETCIDEDRKLGPDDQEFAKALLELWLLDMKYQRTKP